MATFEERFGQLNAEQRKAVEAIEGPVMVVAGPGTGKTEVVALRVANILQKTQMRPGNILCLTFSESGATAMRERLRHLIGSDAYGVAIHTIHGFSNSLIGRYPQTFDAWFARSHIGDIERYRLLNTIIDQLLPHLDLVDRRSPYERTKDILDRIAQVKREGKSIDDLRAAEKEYENVMEHQSKEGTKAHEKNLLAARKFSDFIKVFERYQKSLEERSLYDYEDMILHVLHALRDDEQLLITLQEQYQYVLVDEFQLSSTLGS